MYVTQAPLWVRSSGAQPGTFGIDQLGSAGNMLLDFAIHHPHMKFHPT